MTKEEFLKKILARNDSFNLLRSRVGTPPSQTPTTSEQTSDAYSLLADRVNTTQEPNGAPSTVEGVNDLSFLLERKGGLTQQERMIRDKRRTLDRAVLYSYQGAFIKKKVFDASLLMADELEMANKPHRALINPDKNAQNYDDKMISIGFEYNIRSGDVFEWCNTNTYWLVYLQDLTELAYFRGSIRKCSYQIAWKDADGNSYSTYAAVTGPAEKSINSTKTHGLVIDNPNYSLHILLPKNAATLAAFSRYSKFYLQGSSTCWRVEGVDDISTPNILEIEAIEYYANETTDDVENGKVNGLVAAPVDPNEDATAVNISGDTFIRPRKSYTFTYTGTATGSWSYDSKLPIKAVIDPTDAKKISITWNSSYHGQFDLTYGQSTKTVVVESLF